MLKFRVFEYNQPAEGWPLHTAYLAGSDGTPIRAQIDLDDGQLICEKRETGPAALSMRYHVGELGELMLPTCLLPEREQPYLLSLELARHRLMVLYNKLEDWGLFDLEADHPINRRTERARANFIDALCKQVEAPQEAEQLAQQALAEALDGSEELALIHSERLLNRRRQQGTMPAMSVGVGVGPDLQHERLRSVVTNNFDFLHLPLPWKKLAPEEEGEYRWQGSDQWVQAAQGAGLPILAGPLIASDSENLPDWLYIWEHDYETVRDLMYEHVERVVTRYRDSVQVWNVVSGLHVNKPFSFNFEQIMELTRMTIMLVRKLAPKARTLIEIRQPFGEYYAHNPRSIPPLMYVDLIVQSGMRFDGFAVEMLMGQANPGQHTRDLMQLSNLLDQFAGLNKAVHPFFGCPSEPVTRMMIAAPEASEPIDDNSGFWRRPWSENVQSHWMEAMFQIALSKPFVEGAAWRELVDYPDIALPLSGLMNERLEPKAALRRLIAFRKSLRGEGAQAATPAPDENAPAPATEDDPSPTYKTDEP